MNDLASNSSNNNNNFAIFPIMSLPVEVVLVVLSSLTANDVSLMSGTCRGMFGLCQHNGVWKRVCKRSWSLRPSLGISRPSRWRHYHTQKTTLVREGSFKWDSLKPTGDNLSKRYQHTGSVVGNNIYFIGGQELAEKRFDDIYVLNTENMEVAKVTPAVGVVPRFARHSAVTVGQRILMFGGFDGLSQHFHLSCYDTAQNSWTTPPVSGTLPPSRTNHSAAAIGDKMYMFGGMFKETVYGVDRLVFLNDMHVLDTSNDQLRWTKIAQKGELPSPRCGHRMIPFGKKLVLFGGGCGEQWDKKFADIHVFDTTTSIWTKPVVTGSAPVCTFTAAFAMGVFMFVFGGQSLYDNNLTNDLYALDTVALTWTKVQAENAYPSARDMASGNVIGNNMYMFGGYCGAAIDSWWHLKMDPMLGDLQESMNPDI